jgi:two component transcriptional regulator, winged helix family
MNEILIVEDEERIAAFLAKGLRAAGFPSSTESSGVAAWHKAMSGDYDLIILDVGLPDVNGFEVLRRIRGQGSRIPVIMLTARSSVNDTVKGLEYGADDYIAKPFRFEELVARVRRRLRREAPSEASLTLQHGKLKLDLRTHKASLSGREVELTAREFTLIETFMRHPGEVLSRESLLSAVWGYDFDPNSNVVDVYVRYLRNKLGADVVETVRGAGYRLV